MGLRRTLSWCLCLPVYVCSFQSLIPASMAQDSKAASVPTAPPPPNTLLDGTPVKLRLSQTVSSADAKVGQEIPFEVLEDVQVNGVNVLPKGSSAIATVTEAEHKKRMGRGGKLDISISYARLADNDKLALRAMKESKGGGHVGAMTGAMVATSIVFFPAAPLFLFMHGKDTTIPQGTEITAFVDGDMHLDLSHFGVHGAQNTADADASITQQATLSIDSTPSGADIQIDGSFIGNTPSTLTITPGSHEISVTRKGYTAWTRKIATTGGNIRLSAELEREPSGSGETTPAASTSNTPGTPQ